MVAVPSLRGIACLADYLPANGSPSGFCTIVLTSRAKMDVAVYVTNATAYREKFSRPVTFASFAVALGDARESVTVDAQRPSHGGLSGRYT